MRGQTDYSFVLGIDKPAGMTSHDVVSHVRRVVGERRVGHTGTLDPAATGALAVCVGPAARLDRFLTGHDKVYEFTAVFGTATDTDDAQGAVTRTLPVPASLDDPEFARGQVEALQGSFKQMPPAYSAVKVGGEKSYEAARKGVVIELEPRLVHVHEAKLLGIEHAEGQLAWRMRVHVSAGTYVRSLARDLGRALGTCAHVGQLRRLRAGALDVTWCLPLDALEGAWRQAVLDPVKLLGLRFAFAWGSLATHVRNGRPLDPAQLELCEYDPASRSAEGFCACTSGVRVSPRPLEAGELVSIVCDNELAAVYRHDGGACKPACVFSKGVIRDGERL